MTEKNTNSKFNKIKIVQTASPIGRRLKQKKTLIGLGLNKIRRESLLEDTDSIRGMINKVKHLVKFEIIGRVK